MAKRYDPLNEALNIINKHLIKPSAPGLAQSLHQHRKDYHSGLNLTESEPTGMGALGKFTRNISDWWGDEGSKLAARAGTVSLGVGGAAVPISMLGYGTVRALTPNLRAQTIAQQRLLTRQSRHTTAGIKLIAEHTKIHKGSIKNISNALKHFEKAERAGYRASGSKKGHSLAEGALVSGIASIGIPLAIGLGLHGVRLLARPGMHALNKLGEWLHQFGDPYNVPTPAHKVHKQPEQHIQHAVHQHHHRNYYK